MLKNNESINNHLKDRDIIFSYTSLDNSDQKHQCQQSSVSCDISLKYICDDTNTFTQETSEPISYQSLQHQGSDNELMGKGEDENNDTMFTSEYYQH